MLWTFTGATALFALGRSHRKAARRNNDHLGTILGAFPESISLLQSSLARRGEHIFIEIRAPVGFYIPVLIPHLLYTRLIEPSDDPEDATAHQHRQTAQ